MTFAAAPVPAVPALAALRRPPAWPRALPAALGVVCLLLALALPESAQAGSGRWQWPLSGPPRVVHHFDAPDHPYGPGHRGIDLAVPAGGEILAVEGGTVRFAGAVAGRGVVSIQHADGLISTYEPVVAQVEQGQQVRVGQVLGALKQVGGSHSHCPAQDCLHLGARVGERYLDPLLLLGARGPSVLLPWSGSAPEGGPAAGSGPGAPGGRPQTGGEPAPRAPASRDVPAEVPVPGGDPRRAIPPGALLD